MVRVSGFKERYDMVVPGMVSKVSSTFTERPYMNVKRICMFISTVCMLEKLQQSLLPAGPDAEDVVNEPFIKGGGVIIWGCSQKRLLQNSHKDVRVARAILVPIAVPRICK